MDKSLFQKYIEEMKNMKASATIKDQNVAVKSVVKPTNINASENDADMSGVGNIIVNVTAVRGLYPVANAKVTIFTEENNDKKVFAEVLTDISGKTPIVSLPAPSSFYTDSPDPDRRPYAFYNIRTTADGYIQTDNYNVAVFDKTTSLQNVSLYPISTQADGNRPIVIDEFENYEL